ncbi:MFS transporter [Halobellus salinus]|uniref:MFS transporter n=1 Tax=Halobellus salinus TaxID=931585 RepID=A0A830EJ91_9EURY|nr:MFS transporter [Halobellus salinus]GGI94381.1 MFS transporter [Halobellus salinus]SMP19843.1 Predicted arabinose efflux permease, MFS family [Halobellus salinus]
MAPQRDAVADGDGSADRGSAPATTDRDWTAYGLVVGSALVSAGMAAYEIAPASVTPLVRDSLGVGSTLAGLLVGAMFGTAVVTSLPAGAVLDRTDSRRVMAAAVFTLFVAGVWGWVAGRAGGYWPLIASRIVAGVAYVVVWNAGIDIVSRAVEPAHRATAVGVFTASGPLGFALGQSTGPLLAARFGWPAIFPAYAGVALAGFGLFWHTSRGLGGARADAPTLGEFGTVLRSRPVWIAGGLGFLSYALYLFVNSWGSSYLADQIELSLAASGAIIAVFPAVGVLSRVSSGVLSDRVFGGRRRPVVLGSFGVAAPLVLAFTRLGSVPVVVGALLCVGFAIQLTIGLSFSYVRELVDANVAATAVAFQTSVGLAGAFVSPIVGGAVVDAAGFDVAFLVAGAIAVAGAVLAWWAPEPA